MRKIVASLTFLLIFSISLFSANVVPVVNLPAKPTKQLMSRLNKNAELFADKVISYYAVAVCYEAQLNLMGIKPVRELVAPTTDQLSKPSLKTLQTHWQQAAILHRQVAGVEVTADNPRTEVLRGNVFELQSELSNLKVKNTELELKLKELEIYPELYDLSRKSVDGFKEQINRHTIPTLGISTGVTTLLFSDDRINANAGVEVGLVFNPTPLLGIPNFFDIWFDYSTPDIKAHHSGYFYDNYYDETMVHNTNVLSLGANLVLPLSRILDIEKYAWNLKGGVGYYWIDDKVPNTYLESNLWKGVMFKVEMEFINLTTRFPFGLYASATFNQTNAGLMLNSPNYYYQPDGIDFGKKWFNSLNAGLRFYLTGIYK